MNDGAKLPLKFGQEEQRVPSGFGSGMLIRGLTPYIGPNGNWWTGEIDSGIAATGPAGADGRRGTGIITMTTAPSVYTTAIGDYRPQYRIALSTVKTQAGVAEVLIGDIIQHSFNQYLIDHLDTSYAYISRTRLSIRGSAGKDGTPFTYDMFTAEQLEALRGPGGPEGPPGTTDYNKLENKPFDIEQGVILSETSVLAEAEDGDVAMFVLNKSLDLVEGEAYTVTWNGVEYTCTAKWMMDERGLGALCLGNTSVADTGGTGEPFIIATINKAITDAMGIGEMTVGIAIDGVTSVQLSIRGAIIKHIDNKYLDPFFEIVSDREVFPEETLAFRFADFIFEHTYSERLPLIAGRKYTVILNGVEYVCECKSYAVQDNIVVWLGDFHKLLYDPDIPKTDEPFCVFTTFYGEPITIFVVENPTDYGDKYTYTEDHTFAIFEKDCRELFLKPKHLPMEFIVQKVMEELPEIGEGTDGKDGIGIKTIEQTVTSAEDGGENIVTVTLTDGTTKTFTIKNGSKGSAGKDGAPGKDGANGKDGADGQRGTGTLKVTTQPSSYTTAIGDYTPKYRIALATVISQSKKTEVLLGDLIQYSYYQYQVDYLDDTYAYISAARVSIRGATGAAGSDASVTADNIKSALGYTPADAADLTQLSNEKVDYSDLEDEEFQTSVAQKVPFVKTAEQPTFVNSVDEMTDTSKVYVLSEDGYFYKYTDGNTLVEKLTADDFMQADMTVNGLHYIGSYGGLSRLYTKDILPLDGCTIAVSCPSAYYGFIVYFYNTDTPTETGVATLSENLTGKTTWLGGSVTDITTVTCSTGTLEGATHCRIAFRHNTSAADITDYIDDLVASEPVVITHSSAEAWTNTGLAYNQPADYEDRIVALEKAFGGIVNGTY